MNALKRNTKVIMVVVFIMIFEWYGLKQYYNYIPTSAPTPKIMCKNREIVLKNADFNWFDKDSGGNSNIFGDPAETLRDYKPVDVGSEDSLEYSFPQKPPRIVSITITKWYGSQWKLVDRYFRFYSDKKEDRIILLPKEKGIYIYEIDGEWDETHNTANIFKINVN